MHYDVPEAIRKAARHPHEILLINLITNHILVFVITLGLAKTFPAGMLLTPVLSLLILLYLLWRAARSARRDSWFVFCHWQLAARRSRAFIGMLLILALIILGLLLAVGFEPDKLRPGHYALAGVAIFPTMLTVLVLIVIESDAMHKARLGEVPAGIVKRFPPPAEQD
jgi:hypothetical protein